MVAGSLEDTPPILITAWDKTYSRVGPVPAFNSCEITFMHNGPGEALFELDADHPRVADLAAPGARAVLCYTPADLWFSGTVEEVTGAGAAPVATRTFRVRDDWLDVFQDLVGWPNPDGAIDEQGDEGAYYKVSGKAETVVKDIVAQNATRNGLHLTIPASGGLGQDVTVQVRMHQLWDRLQPAVEQAGLGFRVVQKASPDRVLEVYEPVTVAAVLTEDSGIVEEGSYKLSPPTVTRVVVGAGGEGVARSFFQKIDSAAESLWGVKREVFIDARDLNPDELDPEDLEAEALERADEALFEGAAKSGLQVVLSETDHFRFGSAFNLGDLVSIQLTGAPVLQDRVREVHVEWSATDGLLVTPIVGEWTDSTDDKINKVVAAAAKGVRSLRSAL